MNFFKKAPRGFWYYWIFWVGFVAYLFWTGELFEGGGVIMIFLAVVVIIESYNRTRR